MARWGGGGGVSGVRKANVVGLLSPYSWLNEGACRNVIIRSAACGSIGNCLERWDGQSLSGKNEMKLI